MGQCSSELSVTYQNELCLWFGLHLQPIPETVVSESCFVAVTLKYAPTYIDICTRDRTLQCCCVTDMTGAVWHDSDTCRVVSQTGRRLNNPPSARSHDAVSVTERRQSEQGCVICYTSRCMRAVFCLGTARRYQASAVCRIAPPGRPQAALCSRHCSSYLTNYLNSRITRKRAGPAGAIRSEDNLITAASGAAPLIEATRLADSGGKRKREQYSPRYLNVDRS